MSLDVTITPTVGRKVYFYADDTQVDPHDATVIKVHAPAYQASAFTPVNLLVIDPDDGSGTCHTHVPHSPVPVPYPHYRWMPYQYQQAAKEVDRLMSREKHYLRNVTVAGAGGAGGWAGWNSDHPQGVGTYGIGCNADNLRQDKVDRG